MITPTPVTILATGESRAVSRDSKFTIRKNGKFIKRVMAGFLPKISWVDSIDEATVTNKWIVADELMNSANQRGFNSDADGIAELICIEEAAQ
jgi:hypothetical protein